MLLLVCFTISVGTYCEKFGQSKNGVGQVDFSSTCTTKHNVVKGNTKNYDLCFCSHDDSSKPAPSTSSELVDNRLPTQEGKQTSQKSVVPVNC